MRQPILISNRYKLQKSLRNCIGIPCSESEVSCQSNTNMGCIPPVHKHKQLGATCKTNIWKIFLIVFLQSL
jgi:hypothetical protein